MEYCGRRRFYFSNLQNDDLCDDMKPDIVFDGEEKIELPEKSPIKKVKAKRKSTKKIVKIKDSEDSINESNEKICTVEDSDKEGVVNKNAKTKVKKEKVGKMCQICGQIFKSLQAHLYVHDIFPKFECNICHKKFRHKANVLSHMKIHTNQR